MATTPGRPPTQDDWERVRRAVADGCASNRPAAAPVLADEELLDALALLHALRDQLTGWEPQLIAAARDRGVSWQRLATVLGVATRQAAERRFLRLAPSTTGEITADGRVQAARRRRADDRALQHWAREHAGELRRLAAEVIGLTGLARPGRRHQRELADRLVDDDPALLLVPLAAALPHLTARHSATVKQLTAIAKRIDRIDRADRAGGPSAGEPGG